MAAEGIILNTWAGADVTVGQDQIKDERLAIQPVARSIKKIAVVGSTAAGDTILELLINGTSVGSFQNTSTGVDINQNTDVLNVDFYVPANARVELYCREENAGANPVRSQIQFAKASRTGSGRSTGYRRYYTRRNSGYTRKNTRSGFTR